MKTESLRIPGITCGHCANRVRKTLQPLKGMASVDVDTGARAATIAYDPDVLDRAAALEALADAGYPAEVADGGSGRPAGSCCSGASCGAPNGMPGGSHRDGHGPERFAVR